MAEDPLFFDGFTTLDIQTSDSTSVPIAGIQGVTAVPNVSIEQLYTGDSIKMEAQQQHEAAVDVGIEYAKWDQDATFVQQWLGGDGSSSSSWTDDNNPQKFELSATWDTVGGDRTWDFTITGITFEEFPLVDSSMGEYLSRDLSGTGEDVTDVSTTDNTVA